MKAKSLITPLLGLAALLFFVLFSISTSAVSAGSLPPRPETPTPVPPPSPVEGGVILLQQTGEQPFPGEAWTVVQWRTALGTWAEVEGWQGTFNPWDQVIWWVGPDNLGESSFRWLVYADETESELLVTSETFDLPQHSGSVVVVPVSLEDAE